MPANVETIHANYGHTEDVVTIAKLRELLDGLPDDAEVRMYDDDLGAYAAIFEVRYDFDNKEVLLS